MELFSEEIQAAQSSTQDAIWMGQIHQQKAHDSGWCFTQYNKGDKVLNNLKLLDRMKKAGKGKKLHLLYDGPFEVMEQISPVTYCLRLPDQYPIYLIIYLTHLEKYIQLSPEMGTRPIKPLKWDLMNEDQVIEVEWIIDEGISRDKGRRIKKYVIRWKGYGPEEDHWMTAKWLRNAAEVIKEWESSRRVVPGHIITIWIAFVHIGMFIISNKRNHGPIFGFTQFLLLPATAATCSHIMQLSTAASATDCDAQSGRIDAATAQQMGLLSTANRRRGTASPLILKEPLFYGSRHRSPLP